MPDDRRTRPIGLPIGPNRAIVPGTLLLNNNGDAEWFAGTGLGQQSTPTFTSNASNNFNWTPSANCVDGVTCPTTAQRQLFYGNTSSQTSLNNARLETWNSPTGYNSPQTARSLGIPGTTNVAPTPIPVTPAAAAARTAQQITDAGVTQTNINIPAATQAVHQGTYVYPIDLGTNQQDRIKFTMYESVGATVSGDAASIFATNFSGSIVRRTNSTTSLGEVYLPIQAGITDSNSVDWSGGTLNAFEAAAFGKSLDLMSKSNVANLASQIFNDVKETAKRLAIGGGDNPVAQSLKVYLAQEAVGLQGLLSRTSGAILNPNLELLFNAPTLRPFNFMFRLSPRDEDEATEVRKIIRFFKKGMAVRKAANNVFLRAPNVFDIQYQVGDENAKHKSLPRIKRCALLTCDVDYTPDGTYMTFNDAAKTLTSYQLSLRFSELDPIYDSDYNEPDSTSDEIGY